MRLIDRRIILTTSQFAFCITKIIDPVNVVPWTKIAMLISMDQFPSCNHRQQQERKNMGKGATQLYSARVS
jgi:hypothetical protein